MGSGSDTNDSSKLTEAAEELVKVARLVIEDESLVICKQTLEVLKKLSLVSSSIQTAVESLKTLIESKLDALNQTILNCEEINTILLKNQNLEWAISESKSENYSSLVTSILHSFRKGRAHVVDNYINYELIAQQMEELTGNSPRIERRGNLTTIYYS